MNVSQINSAKEPWAVYTLNARGAVLLVSIGVCICLALWIFAHVTLWRIERDVGVNTSAFAVSLDAARSKYPRFDVAVAYLSIRDKNHLMSRFVWTPINNQPWWDWQRRGGPGTSYDGIPWYDDLLHSRVFYPVVSQAPPASDSEGPFLHAWFSRGRYHYDLVFQERRNLLWIVSKTPPGH
jgi:hypothetical protein